MEKMFGFMDGSAATPIAHPDRNNPRTNKHRIE